MTRSERAETVPGAALVPKHGTTRPARRRVTEYSPGILAFKARYSVPSSPPESVAKPEVKVLTPSFASDPEVTATVAVTPAAVMLAPSCTC